MVGDVFLKHAILDHRYEALPSTNTEPCACYITGCICFVDGGRIPREPAGPTWYPSTIKNKTYTNCYTACKWGCFYHIPTKILYFIKINHPLSKKSEIPV